MRHRLPFMTRSHFDLTRVLVLGALLASAGQQAWSHPKGAEAVEIVLHGLVDQGTITQAMHVVIDALYTREQTDALGRYLDALTERGAISADTRLYLNSLLRVGVPAAGDGPAAPVPATYSGNGNVTLLGRLNPRAPFTYYGDQSSTGQLYEGIWGYASGGREYALLTHSQGLSIIEVTNPNSPVELQFIPGVGGRIHHDVDTYYHAASGKTYAYFGGQEGEHLYSIDLSFLPGTIPGSAIVDLGRTNYAHTLQVKDGLLFTNNAYSSLGCQVFDVQANPANPPLLTQDWSGAGRDCHDSFVRDNRLYSADGYSTRYRIADINGIRSGAAPLFLGETAAKPGIYAHSNWLSDDSHYLFAFEEFNIEDINVFDVSNPASPVNVKTFQWSGDGAANSLVHNGQVRGNLLHVAYYEAGFRVFDITDPLNPFEAGKYDTWRDPDGDGTFDKSITGDYNGAWNVYTALPSGYVLVSDMLSGLFLFQVTPPAPLERTNTATAITTQTPDPSVTGQTYSVSVAVSPVSGSGTPSGSVTIADGAGSTCLVTLVGASGSCSLTANSATARALTAVYSGDTAYNGSTSAPVNHTVNQAGTATTITGDSPDASTTGQAYTVTFTVTVSAPGAGTPTGDVTVNDGAGASCTAAVAAGSCSLASATAGLKTLTAAYAGDANFSVSSDTEAHQVNAPETLPPAPTNLTAAKVFVQQGKKTVLSRIDLTFTDNAGNETSFPIERWKLTKRGATKSCVFEINLTAPAHTGTGTTVYSDTTASTATCKYRVAARNSAGTSVSAEVVVP